MRRIVRCELCGRWYLSITRPSPGITGGYEVTVPPHGPEGYSAYPCGFALSLQISEIPDCNEQHPTIQGVVCSLAKPHNEHKGWTAPIADDDTPNIISSSAVYWK